MGIDVAVVGSANQDLTILTPHHPDPGETVIGSDHRWGAGGKGANQAVAAARLGSRTAFIGVVGDDESGKAMRASLDREGIDLGCLHTDPGTPTGLAVITVDEGGENSIVVSPGANLSLRPSHISDCSTLVENAKVVLAQLEIPVDTVLAAATLASGIFCLNPAPAGELPADLMQHVNVLIPNRGELGTLAASPQPGTFDEIVDAARSIQGAPAVVVTLGEEGAVVVDGGDVTPIPPMKVTAVDTTGAGDAFCGALADALGRGMPLIEAARRAAVAGALAASRPGAQDSIPTRDEVEMRSRM